MLQRVPELAVSVRGVNEISSKNHYEALSVPERVNNYSLD